MSLLLPGYSHIVHRPEPLRKPLVSEKGALRGIFVLPVEGEPDYVSAEEAEHDGSPHRRCADAAPGRPRDPRRTPRITDVHAWNPPAPGRGGTAMARQAESERERRAKVIAAEGEYQASERLRQAADRLESPTALQLKLFQTMGEIARRQSELHYRPPRSRGPTPTLPGLLARRIRGFGAAEERRSEEGGEALRGGHRRVLEGGSWSDAGRGSQPLEKNLRDAVSNPEHVTGSSGCDVQAPVLRDRT